MMTSNEQHDLTGTGTEQGKLEQYEKALYPKDRIRLEEEEEEVVVQTDRCCYLSK